MNGLHPNTTRIATCALVLASLAVGGCRSSSSSGLAGNPFLAPDRVAPPSTRSLAPGQAQPYYQGDPPPIMQSATAPPANAVAAVPAPSTAETLSETGRTLAWNTPGAGVPQSIASPQWPASPTPATITRSDEPAVAVPTDNDSLRFALPAPINPEPAMPMSAAAQPANSAPMQFGPEPQLPSAPGVQQASYNAPAGPIPSAPLLPEVSAPTIPTTPQQAVSPWRTPQMSPSATTGYAPQAAPVAQPVAGQQVVAGGQSYMIPAVPANLYAQQQYSAPANTMAVDMRAVASPAQPGDPNPRIRIPGYDVPQVAADGFRPRGSMR